MTADGGLFVCVSVFFFFYESDSFIFEFLDHFLCGFGAAGASHDSPRTPNVHI